MHYTKLFEICWDDSYNDPDYSIPGTMDTWLKYTSEKDIERLAKTLEFLANALRKRIAPFGPLEIPKSNDQAQSTPPVALGDGEVK